MPKSFLTEKVRKGSLAAKIFPNAPNGEPPVPQQPAPMSIPPASSKIPNPPLNKTMNTADIQAREKRAKVLMDSGATAKQAEQQALMEINQANALASKQMQQEQIGAMLTPQLGKLNPDILSNVQTSPVDIMQAIAAGGRTAIPTAIGGAVVGSPAAGVGAIPGAILGATGGFVSGIINNLKQQKGEVIAAGGKAALTARQTALSALITDTNQHPENSFQNLDLFNEQLSLIEAEYLKLQMETKNTILGEDGTAELARYERFKERGGAREKYIGQMELALLNPDATKSFITASDLGIDTADETAKGGFSLFG